MPLDFSKPRPKSSLSRPRDRRDVDAMTRDRFPRTEIILGLRREGGYWVTRTHEEMQRIKRHVDDMKTEESQASRVSALYAPAVFPTLEEVEQLTDAAMNGIDMYLERDVDPEISIHPVPDKKMALLRVKDQRSRSGTDMAISHEQLKSWSDPHLNMMHIVEACFHRIYRTRATSKIKIEQH